MKNDLMLLFIRLVFVFLLHRVSSSTTNTIYVQRGQTAEICDNQTTLIYAYEYRSFDGRKNLIVEPMKNNRYSNPFRTSLLRIENAVESDSGLYKCPQDDTEWQRLQVYVPTEHVYLQSISSSSAGTGGLSTDPCSTKNCISLIEGEPLDIVCAADGYPRPAMEIIFDRNGSIPTIMALANRHEAVKDLFNEHFRPTIHETYRVVGLTSADNGRNLSCQVDMKSIEKKLFRSTSKQLFIQFRPRVVEKSKKVHVGINQTRTVNCTVLQANPNFLHYQIQGLSPYVQRRMHTEQHDFAFTFDLTPTSIEQFRPFNITANNTIGIDTCTYVSFVNHEVRRCIPDAITHCSVDTSTSNVTITISCTKSYAQGDNEGYACTLFKYNDKTNRKMFEEIARTKSCIFALENFHEPVEFRVAAFNRYGSLPVNTYGYPIRLNQPTLARETPMFSRKFFIVFGSIVGGIFLVFFLCCLCGSCPTDRSKYSNKNHPPPIAIEKVRIVAVHRMNSTKYPRSNTESEELKLHHDETISQLVPHGSEKRSHQNGGVYDIPSEFNGNRYTHPISSTPINSVYHQKSSEKKFLGENESMDSDLQPSRARRIHLVNNKFYGHPSISPPGNESPVYSTTTDLISESGSFLVPSSSQRSYVPPAPKPRYSTLGQIRFSQETPLPKPRSRSNSRNRLNNLHSENSSSFYEERPASSSDSGIGQIDLLSTTAQVPNNDNEQQQQQQPIITSLIVPRGTEC